MIKLHKPGEDNAKELIGHGKVSPKPFTFDAADRDELPGAQGRRISRWPCPPPSARTIRPRRASPDAIAIPSPRAAWSTRGPWRHDPRSRENGHDEIGASAEGLIRLIEDAGGDADHDASTGEGPVESKSLPDGAERRCLIAGLELRAGPDGKGPGTVVGYAAVYDRFSEDLGHFRERIAATPATAWRASGHSSIMTPTCSSADSKAGTLRMKEDALGLRARDRPPRHPGRPRHGRLDPPRGHGRHVLQLHHRARLRTKWAGRRPHPRPGHSGASRKSTTWARSPSRPTRTPSAAMHRFTRPSSTAAAAGGRRRPLIFERPWARQRLAEATLLP